MIKYDENNYVIPGICSNCGWHGNLTLPKGKTVGESNCPKCGCQTIRKSFGATL